MQDNSPYLFTATKPMQATTLRSLWPCPFDQVHVVRSKQYLPSYFTKKGRYDVQTYRLYLFTDGEKPGQPVRLSLLLSLFPSVSYQSIKRMRNICGHCQLDNQGIFMISEGGRDGEAAIYQLDLSLSKPTHTDSLHTLTPRKGRSWPVFLISHLIQKESRDVCIRRAERSMKMKYSCTLESSQAGRWGSQNYKKQTKFTAELQEYSLVIDWEMFNCTHFATCMNASISSNLRSHTAMRMWNIRNLVASCL